jgi:signal transduction histidine kinase
MGLLGMEERVTHLGGSFAVDSHPGQGTALRIELPLPETVAPGPQGAQEGTPQGIPEGAPAATPTESA